MFLNTKLRQLAKRKTDQCVRRFRSFGPPAILTRSKKVVPEPSAPARALNWIRNHESLHGGILVLSGSQDAYPEVTGYLVPTLLEYGEKDLLKRLVRWLLCTQRADGSFTSPDGVPHIFDTGQVLRGLLAVSDLIPAAFMAVERAADYLCSHMINNGKEGFGSRYSGTIPESVHLYVLPPLLKAAQVMERSDYRTSIENCLDFYCKHPDAFQIGTLTHFLGYEIEALIDLGLTDKAISILNRIQEKQSDDGSIPGVGDSIWVCTPGLAQLALCWYKIREWEPADRALDWLERHQEPSGGFLGSYGPGATYFPDNQVSWTVKYYLDAHRLRVSSFIERNVHIFPSRVSIEDGRTQAILEVVRPKDRVIEIGCGKGRFLKAVNQVYPDTQCTGVDILPILLAELPTEIQPLEGSLESVPCSDDSYDVVFSVEAIEHSANLEAAISEMIRITRPGGWVLVIDKHQSQWGRLNCTPWELWPKISTLCKLLKKGCDNVTAEPVGYDGKPPSDNLMVAWLGQKRSRLSGLDWNKTLISPNSQKEIVHRVKCNHLSEWGQAITLATAPKEYVLEIGAGTGEISLSLAQAGRKMTVLDLSKDSLRFIQKCAADLNISIQTVRADATGSLPFQDDMFDSVWSSGLLEHFSPEERLNMFREQVRITKKKVISIVPNSACVAYRAGKVYQEEKGIWPYGVETPILSMLKDFEAAGLHVTSEYTVGTKHALSFLPKNHPLHKSLLSWIAGRSEDDLEDSAQGYLLVTIGTKKNNCKRSDSILI